MKGKILHKLLVVSFASVQLVVNHSLFAHENKLIFELPTERFRSYTKIDKDVSESFKENIIIKMKDSKDGENYWAYQAIQGAFNKTGSKISEYQSIEALKHLMTYCFSLNLTQCNELSNAYEKEIQVAIKKLLSDENESSKADILEFTMGWILFKTFDAISIRDEQGYTQGINWSKVKNLDDLFCKVYWTGEGNIKGKLLTMFHNEKAGSYNEFFRITKNKDVELFKKSWNTWLREFFVICKGKTTPTEVKSVIEKVAEKNSAVFCVFEEDAPPPIINFSINNNNQNNNINNNTNVNNNSNNNGQINNMQNRNNNLNNNYQNKNNMNNINYNTINNNQNRNFNLNYNTNNINFNNINNMNNRNNINYNNFPQNNMFNKRNNINNSQGMNFSQNNLNYNNNPPINLKLKTPKPLDGRTVSKGLANIGATCYMNASLQCLFHIPELANYLHRDNLPINVYKNDNNRTLTDYSQKVVKEIWEIPTNAKSIIDAECAKFAQQKGLALTKVADYNIYDFLTAGNLGYYAPSDFKERLGNMNPLFKKFEAGDAKDFIIYILEQMHGELKKQSTRPEHVKLRQDIANQPLNQYNSQNAFGHFFAEFTKELSNISDNFFGFNVTTNVCQNCKNCCYNYGIFNCLIMPLEEVKNTRNNIWSQYYMFPSSPCYNSRNTVTLKDCFFYNQKTDLFTGENKNYCNICHQLADSNYTSMIYSAPKILIIILNRGKNNIYNVKLDFPLEFNINNFNGQKFVFANDLPGLYELVGVVTHMGQSGPDAHFVATCRMPNGKGGCGPWYRYNDAIVSKIGDFNKDVINVGTPYVLFYRLKDGQ